MRKKNYFLSLFLLTAVLFSCAPVPQTRDISDYRQELIELSAKIKADPRDSEAFRDLGIICINTEKYRQAEVFLSKSYNFDPGDNKTMFYYGLSLEFNQKDDEAFKVFRRFQEISRLSPYRKLMESHYNILNRKVARTEVRQLMQAEKDIAPEKLSPNLVAIFPLKYRGQNLEYENLGIGLGEMMITDLSQVPGLNIVERIRLNTLMQEVALGQSGLVKEGTSPQYGKLLGAGRVITGYYDIFENKNLRMNMEYWDYINQKPPLNANSSNTLENLFLMEKRMVLGIVSTMGIELTPEQKKEILYIPTKNIHAFIAYCNGMERQDAGQIEQATQFFQQALQLDPKFEQSKEKLMENETTVLMESSNRKKILASVDNIGGGSGTTPGSTENSGAQDKINNRLQSLSNNIGSQFIPGQETRKTTEETVSSGANVGLEVNPNLPLPPTTLDVLPDPPKPPVR
ncbi:hypothetical protein JXQ31_04690 [candidate division KSB1 bacterium]|nr:hypothetical protein [candidate division KSB1 bacterium]